MAPSQQVTETETITACSDYSADSVITTSTVIATDQDGNQHSVTPGTYYHIETSGGPWNDGTDNRDDLAISWDGENWTELGAASLCSSTITGTGILTNVETVTPSLECDSDDCIQISDDTLIWVYEFNNEYVDRVDWADDSAPAFTVVGTQNITYGYSADVMIEWDETTDGDPCDYGTGDTAGSYKFYFRSNSNLYLKDSAPINIGYDNPTRELIRSYDAGINSLSGSYGWRLRIIFDYTFQHCVSYWLDGALFTYVTTDDEFQLGDLISPTIDSEYYLSAASDTLYIRVNDTDGNFGDNTGSKTYTLSGASYTGAAQTCGDRFQLGDLIYERTVDQDDSDLPTGVYFPPVPYNRMTTGEWYAIETTEVPVRNIPGGLTMASRTDISEDELGTTGGGDVYTWESLSEFGACVIETGDNLYRSYFLAENMDYYIRQYRAEGETFTGDMTYKLYGAAYTPPAASCEGRFDLIYHSDGILSAASELGKEIPTAENFSIGWWAVETKNGPWYDENGTSPQYGIQITDDDGESWYDLADFYGADCVVDQYPYDKIYFYVALSNYDKFRLRVDDTDSNWANNSGTIGYTLYKASQLSIEGACDGYVKGDLITQQSVSAKFEEGATMPPESFGYLTGGEWYAIETTGDPWNDGVSDAYTGGLGIYYPGLQTTTFYPLDEYPGYGCVEGNGNYTTLYFKAANETEYRYRAEDPDGVYGNNLGYSTYKLYGVTDADTPAPRCGDEYYVYEKIIAEGDIPANLEGGVEIPHYNLDQTFSKVDYIYIEISEGPWYDDGITASYDIEGLLIRSNPALSQWYDLVDYPGVACFDYQESGHPYAFLDTAVFKLRVDNQVGEFGGNTDHVHYRIYGARLIDSSTDAGEVVPGILPGLFPGGAWGCYGTCFNPPLPNIQASATVTTTFPFIDLSFGSSFGQWFNYIGSKVEYVRCSFSKFLLWCPWHTSTMESIQDLYESKEPYGTMSELVDTFYSVKAEFDSYTWVDEQEGGGVTCHGSDCVMQGDYSPPAIEPPGNFFLAPGEGGGDGPEFIPLPGDEQSIWSGAEFDMTPPTPTFSTNCNTLLIDAMGSLLGGPMCFVLSALDYVGMNVWFQWVFDIGFIGFGVSYAKVRFFGDDS